MLPLKTSCVICAKYILASVYLGGDDRGFTGGQE